MVDELSNYDIAKHEYIYELNYIYCLNVLLFRKYRNDYLEEQRKNEEMKNKMKNRR